MSSQTHVMATIAKMMPTACILFSMNDSLKDVTTDELANQIEKLDQAKQIINSLEGDTQPKKNEL